MLLENGSSMTQILLKRLHSGNAKTLHFQLNPPGGPDYNLAIKLSQKEIYIVLL